MSVKSYSFTLNNYTNEDVEKLKFTLIDLCKSFVLGFEIGENGTPHIQGCVVFHKRQTFAGAKSLIHERCHIEKTIDIKKSFEYCKKDGDFFLHGTLEHASPLDLFKADVKSGIIDTKELREKHSMVFARYNRFAIDYINDNQPVIAKTKHALRDWQASLVEKLRLPADDRSIIFVIDYTGNTGKSWFAHYFAELHDNVQVMSPGKRADLAFVLQNTTKYLFMDCPRSKQQDFIPYDFLEDIKNGYVFCSKYESFYRRLGPVHVIVLMNEDPDFTKLSTDRYDIIKLT